MEDTELPIFEGEEVFVPVTVEYDINELCRLCGNYNNQLMPIFTGDGLEHKLFDKIKEHLSVIQVDPDDDLPSCICYQCASTLISWHDLVYASKIANDRLRSIVQKSQCKEEFLVEPYSDSEVHLLSEGFDELTKIDSDAEQNQAIEFISEAAQCPSPTVLQTDDLLIEDMISSSDLKDESFDYVSTAADSPECDPLTRVAQRVQNSEFRCELCDRQFTSESRLAQHTSRERRCRLCTAEFQDYDTLYSHVLIKHGLLLYRTRRRLRFSGSVPERQKKYECAVCGKRLLYRRSFVMHMRTHSSQRPFRCEHCGKGYSNRNSLQLHLVSEMNRRDHVCMSCGKGYNFKWDLAQHVQQQHESKRYTCHVCGKKFGLLKTYKDHESVHSEEKPFECKKCDMMFRLKKFLERHNRKHHRGTKKQKKQTNASEDIYVINYVDETGNEYGIDVAFTDACDVETVNVESQEDESCQSTVPEDMSCDGDCVQWSVISLPDSEDAVGPLEFPDYLRRFIVEDATGICMQCDSCSFTCEVSRFAFEGHYIKHLRNQTASFRGRRMNYERFVMRGKNGRKYMQCDKCSFSCRQSSLLFRQHYMRCHPFKKKNRLNNIPTFKCDRCEFESPWNNMLELHLFRAHETQPANAANFIKGTGTNRILACDICPFECSPTDAEVLDAHYRTHRTNVRITAHELKADDVHRLSKFILQKENGFQFYCDRCLFVCDELTDFRLHYMSHNEDKQNRQDLLDIDYLSFLSPNKGTITFECDKCEYTDSELDGFKEHYTIHTNVKAEEMVEFHKILRIDSKRKMKFYHCDRCGFICKPLPELFKQHYMVHEMTVYRMLEYLRFNNVRLVFYFVCMDCEYCEPNAVEFRRHLVSAHRERLMPLPAAIERMFQQWSLTPKYTALSKISGRDMVARGVDMRPMLYTNENELHFRCNKCSFTCSFSLETVAEHHYVHNAITNSVGGNTTQKKVGRKATSTLPSSLIKYLKNVRGKMLLHCDKCARQFQQWRAAAFVSHRAKHDTSELTNIQCDKCGKVFESVRILKAHLNRVHSGRVYKCSKCNKIFRSLFGLKCHLKLHETGFKGSGRKKGTAEDVMCERCSRVLKGKSALAIHQRYNVCLNKCKSCDQDFPSPDALKEHARLEHPQCPSIRTCELCGEGYMNRVQHMRKHRTGRDFECHCCGLRFYDKTALRLHIVAKMNLKSRSCSLCSRKFINDYRLRKHMQVHAEELNTDLTVVCPSCEKRFVEQADLERHFQVSHLGLKPYSCELCGKGYTTQRSLAKHRLKERVCIICEELFDTNLILMEHIARMHGIDNYQNIVAENSFNSSKRPILCDLCGKSYFSAIALRQHMLHERTCKICRMRFNDNETLRDHVKEQHDLEDYHSVAMHLRSIKDKPHACDICGKQYASKVVLHRHQKLEVRCIICEIDFGDHDMLKVHLQNEHDILLYRNLITKLSDISAPEPEENGVFSCSVCGKDIHNRTTYDKHMYEHTGVKPYMCEICGRKFALKCSLQKHLLDEMNIHKVDCKYCQQSFNSNGDLNTHMRKEHQDKLFQCDVCAKTFTFLKELNVHYSVHSKERPFTCELCGTKFKVKRYMTRHQRRCGKEFLLRNLIDAEQALLP